MLRGASVTLRRSTPDDHPFILRWQNDPEVFRWMDYEHPFTLEDIRASEERSFEEGVPFVIEAEGRPVGRTGLNNFRRRDGLASLYLFVGDRDAWGKGYGEDALRTLLRYAFETLGLRKIELWSLADNTRAIALYRKVGFREDGRLPERSLHDGRYIDHVVMSVDRDSFMHSMD